MCRINPVLPKDYEEHARRLYAEFPPHLIKIVVKTKGWGDWDPFSNIRPPRSALASIQGQAIKDRLNECFGFPNWELHDSEYIYLGPEKNPSHILLKTNLWVKTPFEEGGWTKSIPVEVHEEIKYGDIGNAMKSVRTAAISKAASELGIGSSVFCGEWKWERWITELKKIGITNEWQLNSGAVEVRNNETPVPEQPQSRTPRRDNGRQQPAKASTPNEANGSRASNQTTPAARLEPPTPDAPPASENPAPPESQGNGETLAYTKTPERVVAWARMLGFTSEEFVSAITGGNKMPVNIDEFLSAPERRKTLVRELLLRRVIDKQAFDSYLKTAYRNLDGKLDRIIHHHDIGGGKAVSCAQMEDLVKRFADLGDGKNPPGWGEKPPEKNGEDKPKPNGNGKPIPVAKRLAEAAEILGLSDDDITESIRATLQTPENTPVPPLATISNDDEFRSSLLVTMMQRAAEYGDKDKIKAWLQEKAGGNWGVVAKASETGEMPIEAINEYVQVGEISAPPF